MTIPTCPFNHKHHLSAEPAGFYCYECGEHYTFDEVKQALDEEEQP